MSIVYICGCGCVCVRMCERESKLKIPTRPVELLANTHGAEGSVREKFQISPGKSFLSLPLYENRKEICATPAPGGRQDNVFKHLLLRRLTLIRPALCDATVWQELFRSVVATGRSPVCLFRVLKRQLRCGNNGDVNVLAHVDVRIPTILVAWPLLFPAETLKQLCRSINQNIEVSR